MSGRLIVTVGLCLMLGCHRQAASSPPVLMAYQVAPQPARVGSTEINLVLRDANSRPLTGVHVNLEADMSHPGMAPVFGESTEMGGGRYQGRIDFTTPGDWVVLVDMTLPSGQKIERQIEVKGVEAK